jgi:hypothetical protein
MEKSIGDFPFFIDNIGIDGNTFHSIRAIGGKFPPIQTVSREKKMEPVTIKGC